MMLWKYVSTFFIFIFILSMALTAHSIPLRENIVSPVTSFDPAISDDSDLINFDKVIEGASVVGLGESTHGSYEFFKMKHRLLKHLVKNKDFSIFAMEESMAVSSLLNEYVLHGTGDPKKILMMGTSVYATAEVLDLINWMREYNLTAEKKVFFTGFDMQDSSLSPKIIHDAMLEAGNQNLELKSQQIANTLKNIEDKQLTREKDAAAGKSAAELKVEDEEILKCEKAFQLDLNQFKKEMIAASDELKSKLGSVKYEWALQNVSLLQQLMAMQIALSHSMDDAIQVRDKYMVENILWIKSQNPGAKLVLWGHSGHMQSAPFVESDGKKSCTMGVRLKDVLKDQYRTITFLTYEGMYDAPSMKRKKIGDCILQIPPVDSLEYKIEALAMPMAFINLRDKNTLPDFLRQPIQSRDLPWAEIDEQFNHVFQDTSLAFDGIFYFRNTTGSFNFFRTKNMKLKNDFFF